MLPPAPVFCSMMIGWPHFGLQLVGGDARQHVVDAAGRERHDELDRLARERALRVRAERQRRKHDSAAAKRSIDFMLERPPAAIVGERTGRCPELEAVKPRGVVAHDALGELGATAARRGNSSTSVVVGQRAVRRFERRALLLLVRRRMRPVAAPDAAVRRGRDQRGEPLRGPAWCSAARGRAGTAPTASSRHAAARRDRAGGGRRRCRAACRRRGRSDRSPPAPAPAPARLALAEQHRQRRDHLHVPAHRCARRPRSRRRPLPACRRPAP